MNSDFWSDRYLQNNTPWDMGSPSPPLIAYLQRLYNKEQKILIPGAGNAYEAEWLWQNGFKNVFVLDISREPLRNFQNRLSSFPEDQLLCEDFFNHIDQYDLIVEQTFFCALPPHLRQDYAQKMYSLLKPGAKLFGLLFDFPLTEEGPPFGGSREEYERYFDSLFSIHRMERSYNSIKPRAGKELFFELIRQS